MPQCLGRKTNGHRCSRQNDSKKRYCWQHSQKSQKQRGGSEKTVVERAEDVINEAINSGYALSSFDLKYIPLNYLKQYKITNLKELKDSNIVKALPGIVNKEKIKQDLWPLAIEYGKVEEKRRKLLHVAGQDQHPDFEKFRQLSVNLMKLEEKIISLVIGEPFEY